MKGVALDLKLARCLRWLVKALCLYGVSWHWVAFGGVSAADGPWVGNLECGEMLVPSTRSAKPFSAFMELHVSKGVVTGKRENSQVVETYSGTLAASGLAEVMASGHWKDDASKSWRIRLNGKQTGSRLEMTGPMESSDGTKRFRVCRMELGNQSQNSKPESSAKPAPQPSVVRPPTVAKDVVPPTPTPSPDAKALAAKRLADEAAAAERTKVLEAEKSRLLAEKAAADKAAAEKAAADRAAAEAAAAEKAAAEKRAAQEKKAPIKARSTMDL